MIKSSYPCIRGSMFEFNSLGIASVRKKNYKKKVVMGSQCFHDYRIKKNAYMIRRIYNLLSTLKHKQLLELSMHASHHLYPIPSPH